MTSKNVPGKITEFKGCLSRSPKVWYCFFFLCACDINIQSLVKKWCLLPVKRMHDPTLIKSGESQPKEQNKKTVWRIWFSQKAICRLFVCWHEVTAWPVSCLCFSFLKLVIKRHRVCAVSVLHAKLKMSSKIQHFKYLEWIHIYWRSTNTFSLWWKNCFIAKLFPCLTFSICCRRQAKEI